MQTIYGKRPIAYAATITGLRISSVDGTALIDNSNATLVSFADGNHILDVHDSSWRKLSGYLKAAGVAETTGDDLLSGAGAFSAITKAATKTVVGITKANPGVVTFAAGHGYTNGSVVYFSGLTEMTELNTQYWQLRANSGDTFQLATVYDTTSLDTSAYGAAETTGGACVQICSLTGWTAGTGWMIVVDGAGALSNTVRRVSATNSALTYNVTQAQGSLLKYTFDINSISAGSFGVIIPNVGTSGTYSTTGSKTHYVTSIAANNYVGLFSKGGPTSAGVLDNLIVKIVTNPSTSGCTISSTKQGTAMDAWTSKDASFTYNAESYYCVVRLAR